MTESEWLECTDPMPMLEYLRGKASDRKLRLFVCACCRALFPLIHDEYNRKAVTTAERYSDGEVSSHERRLAWASARRSAEKRDWRHGAVLMAEDAAIWVVCVALEDDPGTSVWRNSSTDWSLVRARRLKMSQHLIIDESALLRDIFGNPFRTVTLAAAHRTPGIVSVAQAAYDERQLPSGELDPHRLAVLADALEEVGAACELVAHLRRPGPHIRGCHVVDLCLGLT
jgi:hypothetical protein